MVVGIHELIIRIYKTMRGDFNLFLFPTDEGNHRIHSSSEICYEEELATITKQGLQFN
jgi:hypothetical protein